MKNTLSSCQYPAVKTLKRWCQLDECHLKESFSILTIDSDRSLPAVSQFRGFREKVFPVDFHNRSPDEGIHRKIFQWSIRQKGFLRVFLTD
ncbi:hypothetical protein A6X21_06825 [Planctopirus hydrillae]|uniref:Uncharacterized protein n=1 Tax=Planctopirus hydrillae TaxID=1841610 RepID=A0A1C3E9W4_9PLAN|nr:hypothetical protein A6X21_06825 [Planctopirus hydrillae]